MDEKEALDFARKTMRCKNCLFFGEIVVCMNISMRKHRGIGLCTNTNVLTDDVARYNDFGCIFWQPKEET